MCQSEADKAHNDIRQVSDDVLRYLQVTERAPKTILIFLILSLLIKSSIQFATI